MPRNNKSPNILGAFIREERKKLGISLVGLARLVGRTPQYIAQIERGVSSLSDSSSDYIIVSIAEALGCDVSELNKRRNKKRSMPDKKRSDPIAKILTKARISRGLTQKELGRALHLSQTAIHNVEHGLAGEDVIRKVSNFLKVEIPSDLFGDYQSEVSECSEFLGGAGRNTVLRVSVHALVQILRLKGNSRMGVFVKVGDQEIRLLLQKVFKGAS